MHPAWTGQPGQVHLSDWLEGVHSRFDLILANPLILQLETNPYRDVADYDPSLALFAGADGLAAYVAILPQIPASLQYGALFLNGAEQRNTVWVG